MQITVKSTKVAKTGTNKAGPWELIVVTPEDGTDYTTFHKGAKNLTAGSLIDIGEPIIKEGKISFKEYTIISAAALPPGGNGRSGMTPEMWAEKDRLERNSMESMSAFRGIMDLAKVWPTDEKAQKAIGLALDWAIAQLEKPSEAAKSYQVPKSAEKSQKTMKEAEQDIETLWPENSPIDMDWLKESLETLRARHLRAWDEKNLLSYMKTTYKIEADTTLSAAVQLDKGQAAHFCRAIQGALDKSNQ